MTTDNCAATIAEEKHGEFVKQNHVNILLGSYFLVRSSLEMTLTVTKIPPNLIVLLAQIYMLA